MSEFDEKLNQLLSNPDSMAQIMQLAQSLSGSFQEPGAAENSAPQGAPPPPPPPPPSPPSSPPIPDLSQLLHNLDPQMLAGLLPLMRELNSPVSGQREQLLQALKPFLREQRQQNIDKALKLAKLLHIGKTYFLEKRGGRLV